MAKATEPNAAEPKAAELRNSFAPAPSRPSSTATRNGSGLEGRRVLVVDDDVRNIFVLTALLERHGMEVLHAETGREAIQLLHENPSLEVVLMDIMMPEMDGYETMAAVRRLPGFDKLPMIALTAKAMKGDREACLAAGASDYIAKPVDPDQLLSLLRVWLRS
jgi:CheY-like chemotaxis protein